ncbi:related to calpain-like protease palBory [Fusarium fujikuroi IMI 58289]|uniref:Related to calpain-like protease palBory n=1 Tax=Gibberella fujikuroi (strain CBS 195.34 / IMI 58289 / NRRL A-6831) TaxID=1279085 RepID=S0EC86_GIBF5|nr:related to calpain-like protease palBory [Fusarium fujikuroi IMI 58289]KLO95142.1 calpain-like protease palBory [Fusarium fujikuroi]KLP06316.1 calpain-like protease palBory [Fusarium fujikuroi]KLP19248.1 calpain-like protease palBory [Fusarium fujikuroi]CCT71427.1 related to calpain-like protease palBory [Fusarium fujikuroi IMI 58289]
MEKRAQDHIGDARCATESLIRTSSGQAALDYAVQAAELYMRAAGEASTKKDAARLRLKCQQLIAQAEKLKAELTQTPGVLLRTSKLHSNLFPPWTKEPSDEEFQLLPGDEPFTDNAIFTLSPRQTATFGGWKRPRDLHDHVEADDDIFMNSSRGCDLVQDMTTDCSVVASLCAAMNILTGRKSILSSILYPFDRAKGTPKESASGKYVLKLYFNGCFRRVVVDERLPSSISDRTLYVVDRVNPQLIWPALLEKAYLKVRGGYDFPGSNSGTDLWVLTGWIPEQIFLQREDLEVDKLWERIKNAHDSENVVVTLGTGRISAEEEDILGLIGEHDYAIMDLEMIGDGRRLLVKNPWCDGPVWKGGIPQAFDGELPTPYAASPQHKSPPSVAGSFWMTLEDVLQHFESMYLNWNPALFPHRQDHHFTWCMPPPELSSSLVRNPQYLLHSPAGGPVWILVSRHFVDEELEIARNRTDSMAAASGQLGYMSILVFENDGHRVQVSDGDVYRGPYVDSPQTLARFDTSPGRRYTVVVDQHEFPLPDYTLTLSFLSQDQLAVKEAEDAMTCTREVAGSWTRRTAGGSAACTTYATNPQYKLSLAQAGPLSVLLSTNLQDIHVHIDLVWSQGKRVQTLKARDLAGSSGEYRRGCAVVNIPQLDAGVYTVVCSTFDQGQSADFVLRVSSMANVEVQPVPADAAGRLRKTLSPFQLSDGEEVRRAQLSASWLTRMSVTARSVTSPGMDPSNRPSSTLMVRVSVAHGWDPERITIATSGDGEYEELKTIVRTPELDMEPARIQREGMWLVIEIMGAPQVGECIEIEIHSDGPVHVGQWAIV